MKFTITNKSDYLRSVPTPGNTAIEIAARGTLVLDYPKGCQKFFEGLKNYQFDVVSESSELDTKIDNRFKELQNAPRVDASSQVSQIDKKMSPRVAKIIKVFKAPEIKVETPVVKPKIQVNKVEAPKKVEPPKEEVKPEVKEEQKPEVKVEETKVETPATEEKVEEVKTKETPADKSVDDPISLLKDLNSEQLKAICDKLGIATSSTKESTLINKIDRSKATNEDIVKAYKEVVENA